MITEAKRNTINSTSVQSEASWHGDMNRSKEKWKTVTRRGCRTKTSRSEVDRLAGQEVQIKTRSEGTKALVAIIAFVDQ